MHALRDVVQAGRIADDDLVEASGVVPSARSANAYWLNNDSGGEATLYAIDSTGRALGATQIPGATNRDWEALAAGPCPSGRCLYIGDVGDNARARASVTIYRVAEPMPGQPASDSAEAVVITYGSLKHDVEAMWIGPDTSIWLVTKRPLRDRTGRSRPALVLRLGASAWRVDSDTMARTATIVDSLPIAPERGDERTWVTDAAFNEPGTVSKNSEARVAIRTYANLYLFDADPATGALRRLTAMCSLRALPQRTGEALAWRPDDALFFAHEGRRSTLVVGQCP